MGGSPELVLALVATAVLALNVPFGYWRAGCDKFSATWVIAVHAPVPLVVLLRISSGLGWRISTFPVMIAAYFAGQYLGGAARSKLSR